MLGVLMISSCVERIEPYETGPLELRQIVSNTSITSVERSSFFLITGDYSKTERVGTKIKMFAFAGGSYRLIETDISNVRIHINNDIKTPYIKLVLEQYSNRKYKDDEHAVNSINSYLFDTLHIFCSEELLPEKLLPINL